MPCDDCSRTETCPPCVNEEEPRCNTCGHTEGEGCGCPAHAFVSREHCWRCEGTWLIKNAAEPRPQGCIAHGGPDCVCDDPPLTPEEEEEAEDAGCGHVGSYIVNAEDGSRPRVHYACPTCKAEWTRYEDDWENIASAPPQPQRRPPYAVAYAVQGHLYEVALPGDATVEAVDGALVIKHALGMVAGIVGVQPMSFKEGS